MQENTDQQPIQESGSTDQNTACPFCRHFVGRDDLDMRAVANRLGIYELPDDFLLSVVIPIYNEKSTLEKIVAKVREVDLPKELILVDDGSSDGTIEMLHEYEKDDDVRVVYHEKNRGKGAAVRTGFENVSGTVVVIQDADLEYDPSEFPKLIRPILDGKAAVVYGSRFLFDGPHRVLNFWHSWGNRVLTLLSNMFTGLYLTDMETCYKVFRREVVDEIAPTLRQNRFGIEPEMTAKIARRRYRIFEMGISYFGRTYEEGKKIGLRDAFKALWCIIRYWWKD